MEKGIGLRPLTRRDDDVFLSVSGLGDGHPNHEPEYLVSDRMGALRAHQNTVSNSGSLYPQPTTNERQTN